MKLPDRFEFNRRYAHRGLVGSGQLIRRGGMEGAGTDDDQVPDAAPANVIGVDAAQMHTQPVMPATRKMTRFRALSG